MLSKPPCAVQVYGQLGDDTPDVDVSSLKAMYETTQRLIADDKISAGHDISDGGMAVTLLEAAFAGNCGIQVTSRSVGLLLLFTTHACQMRNVWANLISDEVGMSLHA